MARLVASHTDSKKVGEVVLRPRGDLLVGIVRRNGIHIATATTVYEQQRADEDALERLVPGSATNVNLRCGRRRRRVSP